MTAGSDLKLAAVLSVVAGVSVLVAGFSQWWAITFDGTMLLRRWVKVLFAALIAVQLAALGLILAS